jgi:hypothetical protein
MAGQEAGGNSPQPPQPRSRTAARAGTEAETAGSY